MTEDEIAALFQPVPRQTIGSSVTPSNTCTGPVDVDAPVVELTQLLGGDSSGGYRNKARIREIGEDLNREGGIELMRKAYHAVRSKRFDFSQEIWDGIGGWRPKCREFSSDPFGTARSGSAGGTPNNTGTGQVKTMSRERAKVLNDEGIQAAQAGNTELAREVACRNSGRPYLGHSLEQPRGNLQESG